MVVLCAFGLNNVRYVVGNRGAYLYYFGIYLARKNITAKENIEMKRTRSLKRSGFKRKPTKPLRKTPLRVAGKSSTSVLKREIQSLLRSVAILRDGGCVFRKFPQSGKCGGRNKKGELTLQADHLHSRVHAISFGDSRLVICVCPRHHLFYKRQYPAEYEKIARKVIGKERAKLLDRVREDWRPYKMDWVLVKLGLERELKKLQK